MNPDHLIFGINSNRYGLGSRRAADGARREEKFQFCLAPAGLSQIHSCYLNLILSVSSITPALNRPDLLSPGTEAHVERWKLFMQMYITHLSVMARRKQGKNVGAAHISPDSIRLMIRRLATSRIKFEIIFMASSSSSSTLAHQPPDVFARLLHTSLHSI